MDWGSTWDFLWHFLIIFGWIAYLIVLFQILTDLFWRDHETSGVVKAIWVFFLIVFPWITALIYLLARGKGMAQRAHAAAVAAQKAADEYIREAAGARRRRRSQTRRRSWKPARLRRPSSTA